MSIGDILPDVLAECGIDRPSPSVIENTFEMRQIRAFMDTAGRDINRRAEWSLAQAEVSASDVSFIDLPDDFQEMAETGSVVVGSGEFSPARAVVAPELWQMLEREPSEQQFYHMRGGRIYFSPPIGGEGVTVRYVSKNWLIGKAAVENNDDETVFPEYLLQRAVIWRWRRQKGLKYDDELAEYEADLEAAIKADRGVA